jgi:drug/metabolite transporter (DMT)-like permease
VTQSQRALIAVAMTPMLLGVAPIFGKLAISNGIDPFGVAALRTLVAVAFLWLVYALFFRRYIYIYPAGLLGCVVVGMINGIGSLFYYGGLGLVDASMAQLLNGTYIVFAVLLARIGGERVSRRVLLRILIALIGLAMVTGFAVSAPDWLGVGLMLANALMFAGTLILSQYVLYEMPSPTVALYVLTTMAVLVAMVWAAVGSPIQEAALAMGLPAVIALGMTTALSRLAMFASVGALGSLRTSIIAISEIGVALALAFIILNERLTPIQVGGVALLILSLSLVRADDLRPRGKSASALLVGDVASAQFQRIAFHRAFGTAEQDNEFRVMSKLTTSEMMAIQRMMGASSKPVDPFPIQRPISDDESLEPTRPRRPQ